VLDMMRPSSEVLETWFDTVPELRIAYYYLPECSYNIDESGFGVGASQSSRALVSVRDDLERECSAALRAC
jgi:hypothetical protein